MKTRNFKLKQPHNTEEQETNKKKSITAWEKPETKKEQETMSNEIYHCEIMKTSSR